MWTLVAVVLGLAGYDLQLRGLLGGAGFLAIGVGIGIGCAVVGSLAHDALAGSREKL
jgi:hypothetical protein